MIGKIKYKGKYYPYNSYKARSFFLIGEDGKEFEVSNNDIESSFKIYKHYSPADWEMLRRMSVDEVNEYLTLKSLDALEIFYQQLPKPK